MCEMPSQISSVFFFFLFLISNIENEKKGENVFNSVFGGAGD